ncbi:DUF3995 domain-containing protein [uncultured Shimia sp.]|uniref:DUF3995 domain-containing protein n=1 Tax=uncultured Shimia sp. TaxID=573152 RepID=UPI0025E278A3|nr:DUF3995 domain-containing protein [uncultured Shimia sp.]
MVLLTYITFTALLVIASLHVVWGLGILWPVKEEQALVQAIAGFRGADKMPPAGASFLVAALVLVAAMIALDLGEISSLFPHIITIVGGVAVLFVFLGRAILGCTPFWSKLTPEQPFRRLDTVFYTPLCFALGGSFSILTWSSVF